MSPKLKPLQIKLRDRSYSIEVGVSAEKALLRFLTARKARLKRSSRVILMRDERLKDAGKKLLDFLVERKIPVVDLPVPAGEDLKGIQAVYPLYEKLLHGKADRDSVLLALGGGSVGDAAGFIAATYMRGIDWVSLPTTLLAQVDSGVGGKTGINHEAGKNLIGAFHQPSLVVCDPIFLQSLGPREIISGLGEIVKYALVYDSKFFEYLESHLSELLALDEKYLQLAILRSLEWKCKAVSRDEFDRRGVREILNFGHTFGHALEAATHYKFFQHGEAVIWGMRFALALSVERKKLKPQTWLRLDRFLQKFPVPSIPSHLTEDQIFKHMKKDKKAEGDRIRFVLLDRIGHSVSDKGVTGKQLQKAWDRLRAEEKI